MARKLSLISSLVVIILAITSCSKNQRKVGNIEGAYFLILRNGEPVADDDFRSYIFNECLLSNNDYCELKIYGPDTVIDAGYKVTDKGETLIFNDYIDSASYTNINTIDELTDTRLTITNSIPGYSTTLVFER